MSAGLAALYAYWQSKRGRHAMPARADIEPTEIPQLLPIIQFVDRVDGRFRYRLTGTAIVDAYGLDPTGKFVDEILAGERIRLAEYHYRTVFESKRPIIVRSRFLFTDERPALTTIRILLPLSADGYRVDMALVGFDAEYDRRLHRISLATNGQVDSGAYRMEFLDEEAHT